MGRVERAIVTTGGTKEPIDSVRSVGNFSTGKFGYQIAQALVDNGYDVIVQCAKEVPALFGRTIPQAHHEVFTTAQSLQEMLLNKERPDIIFHAAAVADFRPKKVVDGKISSSLESLIIEMEKTPKILPQLRETYGNTAFLVGFKLLSGVKRQELINAAMEQNVKNHLNLTVANDANDLHDGMHPVILVTAEGGAINLVGNREEVAKALVEFVKKRSRVSWYHTEQKLDLPDVPREEKGKFSKLLKFAQNTNLLYDTSGNISMRYGDYVIVTPRQVDKSKTTVDESDIVLVDHESKNVYFKGKIKSSIDTAVSDSLYRHFPNIKYLLHFHSPWGVASSVTAFPQPCGSKEEVDEIFKQIGADQNKSEFAVELLHHGFLIGLPEGGVERLQLEWEKNLEEFKRHLADVQRGYKPEDMVLKPILFDSKIIGIFAEHEDGRVVYVNQDSRGLGVGKKIIDQLIERQKSISTVDECNVVSFYRKFGFRGEKDVKTGMYTFHPPKITDSDPIFGRIDDWKVK